MMNNKTEVYVALQDESKPCPIEVIVDSFISDMGGFHIRNTKYIDIGGINYTRNDLVNHPSFQGYVSALERSITPSEYEDILLERMPRIIDGIIPLTTNKPDYRLAELVFDTFKEKFEKGYNIGIDTRKIILEGYDIN